MNEDRGLGAGNNIEVAVALALHMHIIMKKVLIFTLLTSFASHAAHASSDEIDPQSPEARLMVVRGEIQKAREKRDSDMVKHSGSKYVITVSGLSAIATALYHVWGELDYVKRNGGKVIGADEQNMLRREVNRTPKFRVNHRVMIATVFASVLGIGFEDAFRAEVEISEDQLNKLDEELNTILVSYIRDRSIGLQIEQARALLVEGENASAP